MACLGLFLLPADSSFSVTFCGSIIAVAELAPAARNTPFMQYVHQPYRNVDVEACCRMLAGSLCHVHVSSKAISGCEVDYVDDDARIREHRHPHTSYSLLNTSLVQCCTQHPPSSKQSMNSLVDKVR